MPAETVLVRTDAATVSRLWLESPNGLRAKATLRVPRRAGPRSVTALVIAGGFESGWKAAGRLDPGAGVALLSIDYPYAGRRSRIAPLELARRARELWRGTRAMPSLLSEAASYLARRPEVDPERILIVGASLGVPFALRAAAADSRFRGVALFYGSADLGDWVARNLKGVPAWARRPAGAAVAFLYRDYEPERLIGKVSPRPVLLVNAKGDPRISAEKARRLFEAAKDPREQVWLDGGHVQLSDEELVKRLLQIALGWTRRHGFVRPTQ